MGKWCLLVVAIVRAVSLSTDSTRPSSVRNMAHTGARRSGTPAFTAYDFGPTTPWPRCASTSPPASATPSGVFDHVDVDLLNPAVADDDAARDGPRPRLHRRRPGAPRPTPPTPTTAAGLGTEDDPAFLGMHEASARIAAGHPSRSAQDVWTGEAEHGVNFCGGLHHAMRGHASGFCIYNDVAVGIQWLLDNGAERVAYVDIDVHHGDGVERIFWDDPRVLTISVHENGPGAVPGHRLAGRHRRPGRPGHGRQRGAAARHRRLRPGCARSTPTALPLVRAFAPDVLVTQHGCDTHCPGPAGAPGALGRRAAPASEALHDLAHEVCDGRWVALGGGGYELVEVVPRPGRT